MAYRFVVYDQESVSAYTGNEVTPRFIPEQEVIELRVGDEFFLPGISSIWYTVLDIELGTNSMIYSPCESENQVEFRMDLTEFSREYMNGGAINREDQNVYLRPMGHAIPASPYIGGATHRNAIVGDIRAGDVGGGYAEERVHFDEEHYWSPSPQELGIDMPAPTWPDPLPIEEETFIQGATRVLREQNTWRNAAQQFRHTNPMDDIRELTELLQTTEWALETTTAEEKEPVELSKEVWCF